MAPFVAQRTYSGSHTTIKLQSLLLLLGMDLSDKALRAEFDTKWKPIFSKMLETPDLIIPLDVSEINDAFVEHSFSIGTEYLERTVSYIWHHVSNKAKLSSYSIGTRSRKIQHRHSEVLKPGSPEDIDKLPPKTACNKAASGVVSKFRVIM
jgi:hypothetical protein